MNILTQLAGTGIQIFIASHSYFVIKKLYLTAQAERMSIPVISCDNQEPPTYDDLLNGMPENPIIRESLELYKEEMSL